MPTPVSIVEQWGEHIRQCGWESAEFPASEYGQNPADREDPAIEEAMVWVMPGGEAARVVLARLSDGILPDPKRLFTRYLDCPREARLLLRRLRRHGRVDYCMLCDCQYEYWYDAARDACLGGEPETIRTSYEPRTTNHDRSASPARETVWPLLTLDQARQGRLQEALARPAQTLGDELAAWVSLWVNELGSASESMAPHTAKDMAPHTAKDMAPHAAKGMAPHTAKDMAPHAAKGMAPHAAKGIAPRARRGESRRTPRTIQRFFHQLGLLAKVLSHPEAGKPLGELRARLLSAREFSLLETLSCGFAALERRFPGELMRGAASEHRWLAALEEKRPDLIRKLAWELPSISSSKMSVDVLAEALGDPRVEPVSWRQTITTTPEELARRLTVEGRQILEPLTVEVDREGLGWLLHCARWAIRYWTHRLEEERDRAGSRGERTTGWQLDLLTPWPLGVNADGAVENTILYALGNSLRIRARRPAIRLAVELLLFALALEETSEEPASLPTPLDLNALWL